MPQAPFQVEIQLGHLCNNRCVFCVSGQVSEWRQAGQIPATEVIERITKAHRDGARKLTLLGGEPTIQRSFMEILEHAAGLGFDEIVIFTNGVMTHREGYIEKLLATGANITWRFSVQGGNAEAHDAVVKRQGAFEKITRSMRLLHERGAQITTNMCVNTLSYASLPDYPALCEELGVKQLHVDQVRPRDAGQRSDEELRAMMAPYRDMAPYFARMLEGFDARLGEGFDVNVGNLPYCVLPEWAHRIHHDGELTFTIAVDGTTDLSEPWDKYADKRSDKVKPERCQRCVFDDSCSGIFGKYIELHGDSEFQPVDLEQLRELDRGERFFCHLVEPYVKAWRTATPPEPWRLATLHRDTRQRVVTLGFQHGDSDQRLELELLPRRHDRGGPPFDATTSRFGLRAREPFAGASSANAPSANAPSANAPSANAPSATAPSAIAPSATALRDQLALLRWSLEQLTAGFDDVEVRNEVNEAAYRRRIPKPDRLAEIAKATHARGRVGDYLFAGARRVDAGRGVALYFKDPAGAVVAATVREGEGDEPKVRVVGIPDAAAAATLARAIITG